VSFDPSVRPVHLEHNLSAPLQVIQIAWSPVTGRFDAVLSVDGSTVLAKTPLRVGGTGTETMTVPVYTRAMARGEVVRSADVAMERQPRSQAAANAVESLETAIGQALRRATRPGQPILPSDLTKPNIVARNDAVTLVYEVPGMVLTVRAKALDAGAAGDTVAVLNAQSSRVVQATVTGPGRVTVRSASTVTLN
jgi:flagella basal body P-ring formation protein FlgA